MVGLSIFFIFIKQPELLLWNVINATTPECSHETVTLKWVFYDIGKGMVCIEICLCRIQCFTLSYKRA